MSSEPTEEGALRVTLPADLDDWLDGRAADLGVDRETVLVQLLAAYRAADELGDDVDDRGRPIRGEALVADAVERELASQLDETLESELEATVRSVLAETLDDRIEAEVTRQARTAVESGVADQLSEATDAVQRQVGERIDELEADYEENLDDVRERVVQVKRETDAKAPRDHSHEELDRLEDMAERLADLEGSVTDLGSTVAEHDAVVEDVEDRLRTVAWVVADLRETVESTNGDETVEHIKRAAARADVDRARCENCDTGVDVALLTAPECPHCDATVTNVEPSDGFFGEPRLLVASPLQSGEGE